MVPMTATSLAMCLPQRNLPEAPSISGVEVSVLRQITQDWRQHCRWERHEAVQKSHFRGASDRHRAR